MEILKTVKDYFSVVEPWMIQVFLIVLAFAVLGLFQKRILNRLHRHLKTTVNTWDDAAIDALRRPLTVFLWIIGITLAADIIKTETKAPIFELVEPVRQLGIIACLIWFGWRLIRNIENNYIEKRLPGSSDLTSVLAIGKLVRLAVLITGVLVTLQTLGISITGVLAFGGVGGIALGFAAKDMLANFFGGLVIYLDRPFEVGNWIRSPERSIEGTVEDIGWRLTRIRTFDKRPIYVPNAVFTNAVIENPSRMSHRRIYETIGVRYDDIGRVPAIIGDIRKMLDEHEGIDQNQTIIINFNAFAASSLDIMVYTFTRTVVWTEYHDVKQDVLLRIADIIARHGGEVAYPTSTVHVPDAIMLNRPDEAPSGQEA